MEWRGSAVAGSVADRIVQLVLRFIERRRVRLGVHLSVGVLLGNRGALALLFWCGGLLVVHLLMLRRLARNHVGLL